MAVLRQLPVLFFFCWCGTQLHSTCAALIAALNALLFKPSCCRAYFLPLFDPKRSAKWGDLGASWPSHTSARHDLLHLYNSDATPVPTLRVEVWRSAMRVLDDLLG